MWRGPNLGEPRGERLPFVKRLVDVRQQISGRDVSEIGGRVLPCREITVGPSRLWRARRSEECREVVFQEGFAATIDVGLHGLLPGGGHVGAALGKVGGGGSAVHQYHVVALQRGDRVKQRGRQREGRASCIARRAVDISLIVSSRSAILQSERIGGREVAIKIDVPSLCGIGEFRCVDADSGQ